MTATRPRTAFSAAELIIFVSAAAVLVAIAVPWLMRFLERGRQPVAIELLESVPDSVAPGSAQQIAVVVRRQNGEPAVRRAVEFVSTSVYDLVSPARQDTDTLGVARVSWRIGPEVGERTLRIFVAGTDLETRVVTAAVPLVVRAEAPVLAPPGAAAADPVPEP